MEPIDYRREYESSFTAQTFEERRLWGLVAELDERTERYDLTFMTGPICKEGRMPATPHEMADSTRFYARCEQEMFEKSMVDRQVWKATKMRFWASPEPEAILRKLRKELGI